MLWILASSHTPHRRLDTHLVKGGKSRQQHLRRLLHPEIISKMKKWDPGTLGPFEEETENLWCFESHRTAIKRNGANCCNGAAQCCHPAGPGPPPGPPRPPACASRGTPAPAPAPAGPAGAWGPNRTRSSLWPSLGWRMDGSPGQGSAASAPDSELKIRTILSNAVMWK